MGSTFPKCFRHLVKYLACRAVILAPVNGVLVTVKASQAPKTPQGPFFFCSGGRFTLVHTFTISAFYREFKHYVYGRRQTAKITSDFLFLSCNP